MERCGVPGRCGTPDGWGGGAAVVFGPRVLQAAAPGGPGALVPGGLVLWPRLLKQVQVPSRPGWGGAGPGASRPHHRGSGARAEVLPSRPSFSSRNGRDYSFNAGKQRPSRHRDQGGTERPSLNLTLTEMDAGSWVIFDLPGFNTAAAGTQQDQPGGAAQGQRYLLLQGQGCAVGQGGFQWQWCARPHGRRAWWGNQPPGQPVSCRPVD